MTLISDPSGVRPVPLAFRYPGSKATLMRRGLRRLIPPHEHFVDVFGGTGAVLMNKPRSPVETFNDLNGDLCNVFTVLQNDAKRQRLCRLLGYTPHSRRMFERCLDLLLRGAGDTVTRAWAYLVVANQARAGLDPTIVLPSAWGYRLKSGRRDRWPLLPQFLEQVGRRFRDVQIENSSWESILRRYDGTEVLMVLDPPYPVSVRTSKTLYKHEMTQEDHERLLWAVRRLRALAIVCSYDNALYRRQLAGWRRVRFETFCMISPLATKPPRTETVWMNFVYE
jgi:DNA adenine methylase